MHRAETQNIQTVNVTAHWDADAKVWWATSDEVPGLVTEHATFDGLIQRVLDVLPDLLADPEWGLAPAKPVPVYFHAQGDFFVSA